MKSMNTISESRIEIVSGVIKAQVRQSAKGDTQIFEHIGERWFFVDAVDPEQARLTIWDGGSYEGAILAAEQSTRDGWGPVVDLVI